MSADALPHTLPTIFAEFTIGGLWLLSLAAIALSYMAYDSSGVRAMQSATGLLYIAMALILSGEVLAKSLLFVTAIPT